MIEVRCNSVVLFFCYFRHDLLSVLICDAILVVLLVGFILIVCAGVV